MIKYINLPKTIKSPISSDILILMDKKYPNNGELSVANFFDDCTEIFEPYVAMYLNESTDECIYMPYDE